jgi:hypothetical protein
MSTEEDFNRQETPEEPTEDLKEIINKVINEIGDKADKANKVKSSEVPIFINADFGENIVEIGYIFLSTNEQHVVSVSNGRLQLLQGRQYYIPVNKQIDSDNYNIKVHSDIADRFDVRFVKDALAAVVPIRHNTILKTGEKLCVLYPL